MTTIAKYHVYNSAVLDAPIDQVWRELRDLSCLSRIVFGDSAKDHRWVEGTSVEMIPARFQLTFVASGEVLNEEVSARSELDHSLTYRQLGVGSTLQGYVATYRLHPVTSDPDRTFLEWSRDFGVAPGADPAQVVPYMETLTADQVEAIRRHFAGGAGQAAAV